MAQPLGFDESKNIKREMAASGKKIAVLQKECDRLKGGLDKYQSKLNKLRGQVMSGDVHRGRNSLRASQFDSYDHANLEIIGRFCKTKLFPHHKFLHSSWSKYSPGDKTSLYYKCREEIDLPSIEDEEFYWGNKTVPFINKKYSEIRANIYSNIKGEYIGESKTWWYQNVDIING
jgi:hypothetical protein